jgi:tRNA pseudouridine55 synthase
LESEYNAEFPTEHINQEILEQARQQFIGTLQQVPPIFSAKQVDGKRAYDLARAGKEVVLKANTIEVSDFKIWTERFPEIDFEISCSKGTYIRSIAHDFGHAVQSGGTLISLRRTKSGDFSIENAKTVEEWVEVIRGGSE